MSVNPNQFSDPSTAIQPDSPQGWTQLAETYYVQKLYSEAIAACQNAIALEPNEPLAYVTMGNIYQAQGQIQEAIRSYQQALAINPNLPQAHVNLGSMFYRQGQLESAINSYRQAVNLQPDLAAVHWNLAQVLKHLGQDGEAQISEQRALALNPQLGGADVLFNQGNQLALQGKVEEAIALWQKVVELKPDFAEAYGQMGMVLRHQGKYKEAIPLLEKAIEIKPNLPLAHQHLCGIYRDSSNLAAARKAVDRYIECCHEIDPIMAAIYGISTYQVSGLNHIAKDRFLKLESQLYSKLDRTTLVEIKSLYSNLLFSMPYLRDDLDKNIKLHHRITKKYIEKILKPKYQSISDTIPATFPHSPLRIGILSSHFNRHSVGWCSLDVLRELSNLPVKLYLYCTDRLQADDRTPLFEAIANKFFIPKHYPNGLPTPEEIIQEITNDQIDIILDLDALSLPIHSDIFYYKPAPICISWLGFDALQVSNQTYFLGDEYTHPKGTEKYYTEQLLKMPQSFMAVSGFERVETNPIQLRQTYRISSDQIVYLCVASGRKFNVELVKAQVEILKQVPDSILIYKGLADQDVVISTYRQVCDGLGVGKHRIKFLPRFPREEEHRQVYGIADVFLDSYPYNGGTHTLEALWFNVPVVTYKGEQFLSRMGYSFLQGLSIEEGISESWKDYINWGVRLGQDQVLRTLVQEKLIKSKQSESLVPLWNPQQFAQNLYGIFQQLIKQKTA
jgi:predicted O-linked N-acetylglucosamine transferase (SPINDLY family)